MNSLWGGLVGISTKTKILITVLIAACLQKVGHDIVEGFNSTVIAFGQSGVGKTQCLFGPWSWLPETPEQPVLMSVLEQVFKLALLHGFDAFQFGLSCWELVNDQVC